MTTNIPQGGLLDVLKKKMRQTKEEMERYKDECEEYNKRLHAEIMRREEVSLSAARETCDHLKNGGCLGVYMYVYRVVWPRKLIVNLESERGESRPSPVYTLKRLCCMSHIHICRPYRSLIQYIKSVLIQE